MMEAPKPIIVTAVKQVWFDEEEEFLTKIERQSNILHAYYVKDYQYYHKLSSRFNIPILIVSATNALCAISLNEFLSQKFVSILNAILSSGTGVLGSIQLYMKLNEKMANALRSSINFKRIALKISKELSIDRAQRATQGETFLSECFAEFNTTVEQGNPIEKKLANLLSLGVTVEPPRTPGSSMMRVADSLLALARGQVSQVPSMATFRDGATTRGSSTPDEDV
jgi:hypothetical protein